MDKMEQFIAGFALIFLGLVILAIGPLLTLWAWNQLFGSVLLLQYNFWNWLAVVIFGVFIRGIKIERKK